MFQKQRPRLYNHHEAQADNINGLTGGSYGKLCDLQMQEGQLFRCGRRTAQQPIHDGR